DTGHSLYSHGRSVLVGACASRRLVLFNLFENFWLWCIADYRGRPRRPYSVDSDGIHQNNKLAWSLHKAIRFCANEHSKRSQGRRSLQLATVSMQDELAGILKFAVGRYQPEDIGIEGSVERLGRR